MTEQERLRIFGIEPKANKPQLAPGEDAYQKALAKDQGAADAKLLSSLPNLQQTIFASERVIDELAKTGIQTGPASEFIANTLGMFNTAIGTEVFKSPATIQFIDAALAPQVFTAVKNLGAGTGISNADREFAAKTIGGSTSDPAVIARMQAVTRAVAERNGFFAQVLTRYNAGEISKAELEAFRRRIYGQGTGEFKDGVMVAEGQEAMFSLANLASKYEQDYLNRLSRGAQQRLGTTPAPSSTVVDQFGLEA